MGAKKITLPKVTFRWVTPTADDAVVVALGGTKALARAQSDSFLMLCAIAHEQAGGSTLPAHWVSEGQRLRMAAREQGRAQVIRGQESKTRAANKRFAKRLALVEA